MLKERQIIDMTADRDNIEMTEKVRELEYAALNSTPEEIAQTCAELGKVEYSARALGIACRFRGIEHVKALVEGGASFDAELSNYMVQTYGSYGDNLSVMLLEKMPKNRIPYLVIAPQFDKSAEQDNGNILKPLPFDKRVEILDYLWKNRESAGFDPGELLYYAIVFGDASMEAELKKRKARFSEYRITMLSDKGKRSDLYIWTAILEHLSDKEFIPVLKWITDELGGAKLHCTDGIHTACRDKFRKAENLEYYLKHFDEPKVSKTDILKNAIDMDDTKRLEAAVREGWLKQPRKRDELIRYASDNKKAECAAWLLDFKNRTADLAAERANAEKKMKRELNADPNSLTELKKNWSFKKKEDGTLVITGYKGSGTVLSVPSEIGGARVTEIGEWAFSPHAPRIKEATREFRKTIVETVLPEGLEVIGSNAFCDLVSLEKVNIPKSVISIGEYAFRDCRSLKSVVVPEGVREIGDNAFSILSGMGALEYAELPSTLKIFGNGCDWWRPYLFNSSCCPKLIVAVPHAPHVEEFCEHNNVKFKYKDYSNPIKNKQKARSD